jgi:hypothetical protein
MDVSVKINCKCKDIFNLLVQYSDTIANYFGINEEDLTFSQVLEYFDTFQRDKVQLIESK